MDEAIQIQNSIFEKIKRNEASLNVLKDMTIPKQIIYGTLLNKNSSFKYLIDVRNALIVYNELLDLEKIVPNDMKVKYNITAIKLKLWRYKAIDIDKSQLKDEIQGLKNYGIDNSLITKMMVNYYIINTENAIRQKDYQDKDMSLKYIENNYSQLSLSDYDYLSLAQFFSYYAGTNLSVKLLSDKVNAIEVDEDLLFYYLNLTIINREQTHSPDYRTIMLNALNMNQERFCKLFGPSGEGGVTFQLLEDSYLRRTYCESCNN